MMNEGDDPSTGYCRVCGTWARPPFEGYYHDSVCSRACFDEFKWRETLRIMRKRYYPDPRGNASESTTSS